MAVARPLFGDGYPLFEGSLSVPEPLPGNANIAGRDYLIDLRKYRRSGVPTLRENAVTSGEPDDQLFDSEGAWWRYRSDWSHGAGQRRLDLGTERDAARFWESRGIDVWDPYNACLLPTTELERAVATSGDGLRMVVVDQFVYYADGTNVYRSSDLSSWTQVTGLAGTPRDLAGDGVDCFVATSTNLYRVAPGSPAAVAATSAGAPGAGYHTVAFVGNRLLASGENVLYEIGASTADTILTHGQPAFRWTTIFSIGSRIYVGGFAGNRSELITLQTLDDGALARGPEAAPFGPGELLRTGLSYGGAALLGTSLGIRFAQIGGDGSLTYGPLIDDPGDVRCICAEGRYAWFGWSTFLETGSGVGRLDLATQPAALQPAYASDVFTEADTEIVRAVVRFDDRTLFLLDGNGIYASSEDTYLSTGWLDTGDVYFGTVERKGLTEIQLRFDPLVASETVSVEVDDQAGVSIGTGSVDTDSADGLLLDLEGDRCDFANMRITLTGPGATTPCLKLWRLRAYTTPPVVERFIVPIILHDKLVLGSGDGYVVSFAVLEEQEFLISLWRSKEVIGFRIGDRTYRVRVNNYEEMPTSWTDDKDTPQGTFTVELLTV